MGEEGQKERAGILFSLLRGPGVQGDGEGVIYLFVIKKLLFIINNCLYLFIINKQRPWLFIFVVLLKVFPG